jgi:hypothetical protein
MTPSGFPEPSPAANAVSSSTAIRCPSSPAKNWSKSPAASCASSSEAITFVAALNAPMLT